MDILSLNAEVKLVAAASSIGRNPLSWQGWHCLRILIEDVSEDNQQEILIWSKSILESYLKDAEGRVYYCEGRDIHVICRDVPRAILEQAGIKSAILFSTKAICLSPMTFMSLARRAPSTTKLF